MNEVFSKGIMQFRPRDRTLEKSITLQKESLEKNSCTPAEASKIRGLKGFTMTGMYGRVGRVGQGALKQRQYSDKEPWLLSGELRRALQFGILVDQLSPPRVVSLYGSEKRALIVASDGRLDDEMPASCGYLVFDPENPEDRFGGYAVLPRELYELLGSDLTIAVVEAAGLVGTS